MKKSEDKKIAELANGVLIGDRRALSRAITVVESTRVDDRDLAENLICRLLPHTGGSVRIGISGVPGVGKSTFIEALGLHIIAMGKTLSVLAIDPSSPNTGGSIMGDKTRMPELSRNKNAFIRPTPSAGTLGGIARYTREVMLLVEAAGVDVVLVETVGVGQSEFAVANLVDMFILLVAPGGGDDLQGIKKGIVELADLLIVTKTDGDLMPAAERAQADYSTALNLFKPTSSGWKPKVIACSAHTKRGIAESWDEIQSCYDTFSSSGSLSMRRREQAKKEMWCEISENILKDIKSDKNVTTILPELESMVEKGTMSPTEAARNLLLKYIKKA